MKKITILLCYLLICIELFAQNTQKPLLIINPEGHKGKIKSLIVTADKKQIVTGGFDKTIKVWDIESGEIIREILGEIGTGSNGMIYTTALSPDNKLLATGGWFGKDNETEILGDIRIYDFKTGKLLTLLKAHRNVINALEFTPDSKKLLSADADGDLFLWDINSKKIIQKYNQKDTKKEFSIDDEIRDIALNGNNFITADQYGRIKFWNLDKKDSIRCDHYYEQTQADGVAYSPDGKYMVAVVDTFLTIYDSNYKPVAEATGSLAFVFATFSPDSKKILFGSSGKGDKHSCSVLSLENGEWTPYAEFENINNSVFAGSFIDNNTFAIAGGSKDEIVIVKLNKINELPTEIKRMTGKGDILYSAALSGNKLSYADMWTENFGFSKFNHQFDLFTKEFESVDSITNWNKPVIKNGDFSLKRYRIGNALNGGLYILKNNNVYDSIPLEYWNGDEHRTFSIVKEFIVSGAANGILKAYNYNGIESSRFIGHVGDIEGLSISADGKRLISASNDRTIKIWPLENLGILHNNDTTISIADYYKRLNTYNVFEKVIKLLNVEQESKSTSKESWLKVINALIKNGYACGTLKNKFAELFSNEIFPIVSVFVDDEGDWIIWNEKGYFTSSKKGSKFVGYHINQGIEKESKYYPFEQFDLKYNRPDLILKDLSMANDDIINLYYLAYQKRLKRMNIDENQLSEDIHLPELSINNYQFNQQKNEAIISISAIDEKYELERLNVYVNDVPIYGTNGINLKTTPIKNYNTQLNIQLSPGKNKVQISVLNNKGAESLKETIKIINNEVTKTDLYLISLGVSKYKDSRFDLNFASKDANDIVKFFEKSNLYNNVYVKELTNEQTTKSNILKIKDDFLKTAQVKDVVIIFAAGHGLLDNKMNYYFGTWDIDFNNPAVGGITYEELELIFDGIKPIKKLFLMDSCHSGELDKDEYSIADNTKVETGDVTFRNAGTVNTVFKNGIEISQSSLLVSNLFNDLRRGTGATIISSAGGAEIAMEGDIWKNGLFTYCFLSGIKEKTADKNKDGIIMLSEIQDYVYNKVTELSKGKQKPTTRRENLEFDFRIW